MELSHNTSEEERVSEEYKSFNREGAVSVDESGPSVWESIARWSLYILGLGTALWFLPVTIAPIETNKLLFIAVFSIVGFIAWLGKSIYEGSVKIPGAFPFVALAVWLLIYFLSSLFSSSFDISFWSFAPTSFFNILMGGLVAFIAAVNLRERYIWRVYWLILISGGVIVLFGLIQSGAGIDIFPWEFAKARTFNMVGQWNILGIFLGFILMAITPLLGASEVSFAKKIILWAIAVGALVLTVLVNFVFVWAGIGLVSLAYLAYLFSRTSGKRIAVPLALLLISVFFILSKDQTSDILAGYINPPLDLIPFTSTTLRIGKEVVSKDPLFGTGPGTFFQAWDLYKDPDINYDIFWRLRFGTGSSFASTLLTTTGILGTLAFLTFVGTTIWFGLRRLGQVSREGGARGALFAGNFLALLFLLYAWFVYPLSIVGSFFVFLSLGLLVAQARDMNSTSERTVPIMADSSKGFIVALAIIFLMVSGVVGLYLSGKKYAGAVYYGRGVEVFNQDQAVNTAEALFIKATNLDPSRDQYYRSISQMSLIKLQRLFQSIEGMSDKEAIEAFRSSQIGALSAAQAAKDINPADYINWRLIGQVHEAVIPLVKNAPSEAVEAYKGAVARSPHDPVLLDDLARMYIAQGNYVSAREALEKAISLKRDFATAHFRLAQIAAIKGNIEEATQNAEMALQSASEDMGILFQLGLLYYEQDKLENAEIIFARAVDINKNFSNARYFLGLTYARRNNIEAAIEEFEKILELNPDNIEVQIILDNLRADRDPLRGISEEPLGREDLPVGEEGAGLEKEEFSQQEKIPEGGQ